MVTAKPIVIPSNKRRDGSYLVFIRVYFNGKVRRIPTSVVCRPGDLTRGLRIKSQSVLEAAGLVVKKMMGAVEGEVCILPGGIAYVKEKNNETLKQHLLDNFKTGDKVRIIIVNEDKE